VKVATFTVRATVHQSARWKQAAEAEGFASVGAWAAPAFDAYLELQARAGRPVPLAWRRGRFKVDGREVRGKISPPFGTYSVQEGIDRHALIYLPTGPPGRHPRLPGAL
jgi:hypothetical protein